MSVLLVSGCTHAGRPDLTSDERVEARKQLNQWPDGRIVDYQSSDGVKLHARLYGADPASAVIVALHGIETNSRWYALLAAKLTPGGVSVLAIDRRGSGLNATLGGIGQMGPKESYNQWLQDIGAAMSFAATFNRPLYLMGNSWGGNPVLAWSAAARSPKGFRGTILLTPGLISRKPTFWQQLTILFSPDSALLGTCLSVKDYSQHRSTWALLEGDPSLTHDVSARFFKQTKQLREEAINHLARVNAPILLLLAGKDELMKNEAMTSALTKGVPAPFLRVVTLPDDYHLVLVEHPKEVAAEILGFLHSTNHRQ
jgi:lysophospholipase